MGIGDILHDIKFRLTHNLSRADALKFHNCYVKSRIEDGDTFTDHEMDVLRKWCYEDYTLDGELYLEARRIRSEQTKGI